MVIQDNNSFLYGVDRYGKVWYLNSAVSSNHKSKPNISSSSKDTSQDSHPQLQWKLLPNPTQISIKRVSSHNGVIWGIGSDHKIYIYLHKQDIPIRIREETYENERWNPINGFCSQLLPTDRPHFSSEDGLHSKSKDSFKLPPSNSWTWESDWQIEDIFENELLDPECWTYAVDFPANYHREKGWKSCVRRRKWFRIRRFIGFNKWLQIDQIHKDHTQEPFTDISINSFGQESSSGLSVWAVTILGQIYYREGVSEIRPEGREWVLTPVKKGLEACQLTVSSQGIPIVVSWTGSCLYRRGITPHNPHGSEWIETNGPPGGINMVSGGDKSLWALSRDKKCWVLKGDFSQFIHSQLNTPFEWIAIPGLMKSISVNKTDTVVLAMGEDENVMLARIGIDSEHPHGTGWKEIFTTASWDHSYISTTTSSYYDTDSLHQSPTTSIISKSPSSFSWIMIWNEDKPKARVSISYKTHESTDERDGSTLDISEIISAKDNSDSLSISSIRADLPDGDEGRNLNLNCNFMNANGEGEEVSFCWVDGSCLSSIKPGLESELEVGSWRDEIVESLKSLHRNQLKFKYEEAVEESGGEWKSKSTPASLLLHGEDSSWTQGELDILNNQSIVFHKSLDHRWVCGINDILSILRTRELTHCLTLRIRNPIETGVSDFVSFKYANESEMEDWHQTLIELTARNPDNFSMGNIWLTTNNGDVHECGQLKIADTAVGADIEVPSDSGWSSHIPLIKGFLPGSKLELLIRLHSSPQWFSFNLEGKSSLPLHFNARFTSSPVVVRNSKLRGEWGEEERDGVFPFVGNGKYGVVIECHETHYSVRVKREGRETVWSFKHRIGPKFVTNFSTGGDVAILSIRYDPKTGDSASTLEFVTIPRPGHFWKIESAPNGYGWGTSYDSNVWMYTLHSNHNKRYESDHLGLMVDNETKVVYENERWNPVSGFGSHFLPTDRSHWSDVSGRLSIGKESIKLGSSAWTWASDWEIDYGDSKGVDGEGWEYAIDFPASYHPHKRFNDFVRRRRWKRTCKYSASAPWTHIPGAKLIDLSIQMNEECDWEVLGVSKDGEAIKRCGITPESPPGTHWEPIPCQKPLISISGCYGHKIWAIGKDGFSYIRYASNWQILDRPKESPLKIVRVGQSGVWAIGTNNTLYRRSDVQPLFPEGREWVKISEDVAQISLGLNDEVWALLKRGDLFSNTLAKRLSISKNSLGGIGWEIVAEGPWNYFTIYGAYKRNR